ncbi:hypothetical protein Megpolyxen_00915 [Candidatus Megaera polyxenophila]|nr:hypothetical protein Megpolyxen_00915 [Candidatus Megaera polyxenophila]
MKSMALDASSRIALIVVNDPIVVNRNIIPGCGESALHKATNYKPFNY